ncbi:MAG: putative Diadenosine tetraphosphate (Ap4A) hydrolase [Caulobacter sp.]|nr:putative Diadenosine tetraphosphate (Ap4A) hydrolase [Caulobacter sp.]
MADFAPDPAFEAGSKAAGELALCHVRLQDDARYPWVILIPRQVGLVELSDLKVADRARLMEEIVAAGDMVRDLAALDGDPVDKLNVGALGNVTTQLHVHVVGRRRGDDAWPGPVWGAGTARAYDPQALALRLSALSARLAPRAA